LRALEFAFLLDEIRGARGAEARRIGRRVFGFARMPLHNRFDHFHFRKLHLRGPDSQARCFAVSDFATNRGEHALLDFVLAAAFQNPGMKE
jgi:hypothetical protein